MVGEILAGMLWHSFESLLRRIKFFAKLIGIVRAVIIIFLAWRTNQNRVLDDNVVVFFRFWSFGKAVMITPFWSFETMQITILFDFIEINLLQNYWFIALLFFCIFWLDHFNHFFLLEVKSFRINKLSFSLYLDFSLFFTSII